MPRHALTHNEQRAVTSAGLASVVLMFMVWFVMPRLNALAFAPGEILPLPIRLFQACYTLWPFILLAAAVIGVLLSRLDPAGPWRRALLILDWVLTACAIALIALGAVAAYLPVFLLPGRI
jgi:hypothetical protein